MIEWPQSDGSGPGGGLAGKHTSILTWLIESVGSLFGMKAGYRGGGTIIE